MVSGSVARSHISRHKCNNIGGPAVVRITATLLHGVNDATQQMSTSELSSAVQDDGGVISLIGTAFLSRRACLRGPSTTILWASEARLPPGKVEFTTNSGGWLVRFRSPSHLHFRTPSAPMEQINYLLAKRGFSGVSHPNVRAETFFFLNSSPVRCEKEIIYPT
ncbi:hypothetical protein VTO42DRAFT_5899 [Malbranchea cinnamomea]